jgi:hypothetical protein
MERRRWVVPVSVAVAVLAAIAIPVVVGIVVYLTWISIPSS